MDRTEKRVLFENKEICREFFEKAKSAFGFSTWNEMYEYFGINRTQFQTYVYGQLSTPLSLYEKCAAKLAVLEKGYFDKHSEIRKGNWGTIKGGKVMSQKYPEILAAGRKLGLKSLEQFRGSRENHGYAIKNFDLNMPLTEKLCEFVGAFIGDGYNGKCGRHYNFQMAGHKILDVAYLEYLSENIKNMFEGIKTRFRRYSKWNSMWMIINSKQLFELLTKRFGFPSGPKTFTVKIPDEIMNSEEKFIFSTIRGITDTDGGVFLDTRKAYAKPYPRITLVTVSKPLYLQLKNILGEYFSIYAADKSKPNKIKYEVTIYGHKQINKWMNLIGFSNYRHLRKIESLRRDSNPRPADFPPLKS